MCWGAEGKTGHESRVASEGEREDVGRVSLLASLRPVSRAEQSLKIQSSVKRSWAINKYFKNKIKTKILQINCDSTDDSATEGHEDSGK